MQNMNQTVKNIIHAILTAFLLAGCSDFLQTENPSEITDDFYNTKTGQESLLVDIYSQYRSVFATGELQYYGTDLYMAITESPDEKMFNGYDASFNGTAGIVGNYWSALYKIVQECNILLNRIQLTAEDASTPEYASLIAQGRFLRVLAYYYLVETFGPVPFYAEESTSIITSVNRKPENEIYSFMIEELQAIKDILPAKAGEAGRVSNAAVLQLLGKLYLTRAYRSYAEAGDFPDAASAFEDIIGKSGHELLPSFASVFDEENQNNNEIIWSIRYGTDKNYYGSGNSQQSLFGFNITALNPDLFIANQKDYSFMERKYWINPRVHELFTDPVEDSRYDATFQREFYVNNTNSSALGSLGIYFPRWNDASGDTQGAVFYYPFKKDGEYNWYPQSTAIAVLNQGSDRMPVIRKWKDTQMVWKGGGVREDIIMRLGDTYLLCAEAYLGANQPDKALEKVNRIRTRAAVSNIESMKLNSIDLDILMDERARELLGEHDRWIDLKRCGLLISRAKAYNLFVQKYDNITEDHWVRPIPQDEIDRLTGLEQNNGY
jgi:hypothetical protein